MSVWQGTGNGALMEEAGCTCALPEYCFTNYLEPGFKDEDVQVEICESVVESKEEVGKGFRPTQNRVCEC